MCIQGLIEPIEGFPENIPVGRGGTVPMLVADPFGKEGKLLHKHLQFTTGPFKTGTILEILFSANNNQASLDEPVDSIGKPPEDISVVAGINTDLARAEGLADDAFPAFTAGLHAGKLDAIRESHLDGPIGIGKDKIVAGSVVVEFLEVLEKAGFEKSVWHGGRRL